MIQQVDVIHWLFNVAHLDDDRKVDFRNIPIPTIATVHHVCSDEIYKIEEAAYADIIHVVSIEWLHFLGAHSKTPVIYASLGIMPDDFKKINPDLYTGNGAFKLGMMGSYPGKFNRKRIDIAIEVLKKLVDNSMNIELLIQGRGWEQFYNDFEEIGVKFTHQKLTSDRKALKFFESIHVYLCTSDFEGGPLPILESLASGVPVISTNIGIAADALKKGGGILCPKADVSALVDAVVSMKEDHEKYLECASKSKNIASNYSWPELNNLYKTLFKEAITTWEANNLKPWVYRNAKIIPASEQRKIELLYDNLRQSLQLLGRGDKVVGLKLALRPIMSGKINLKRKWLFIRTSLRQFFKN
ncbi:glycosyltransferase family 4 protein [Aestuariivivens sediminicola]|uniref:glycosyltransferase family 4 protein n=1 Tax=Aestuariivivens sediminicola TaxID=2913560 RepID=UPI001F55FEA3|nr:glycosyltransferase [Aestuariivivens sediminicola]